MLALSSLTEVSCWLTVEVSKKIQVVLMLQYSVLLLFYCHVLIFFSFIIINKSELLEYEFIFMII